MIQETYEVGRATDARHGRMYSVRMGTDRARWVVDRLVGVGGVFVSVWSPAEGGRIVEVREVDRERLLAVLATSPAGEGAAFRERTV